MTLRQALLAGLALTVWGCSADSSIPIEPSVLTGTPNNVQSFSGTLAPASANISGFTVAQGGLVNVTLASAGPPPTITVGLGIGTPAIGNTCSLLPQANLATSAASTAQISVPLNAGSYCLEVYDVGNLVSPVQWTATVAHP